MTDTAPTVDDNPTSLMCSPCVGTLRSAGRRFIQIEPLLERDRNGKKVLDGDGRDIFLEGRCESCGELVTPINQTQLRHPEGDSRTPG